MSRKRAEWKEGKVSELKFLVCVRDLIYHPTVFLVPKVAASRFTLSSKEKFFFPE